MISFWVTKDNHENLKPVLFVIINGFCYIDCYLPSNILSLGFSHNFFFISFLWRLSNIWHWCSIVDSLKWTTWITGITLYRNNYLIKLSLNVYFATRFRQTSYECWQSCYWTPYWPCRTPPPPSPGCQSAFTTTSPPRPVRPCSATCASAALAGCRSTLGCCWCAYVATSPGGVISWVPSYSSTSPLSSLRYFHRTGKNALTLPV